MRRWFLAILIPVAFQIGFAAWTLAWLPERIATHFGMSGEPDGWMAPAGYFAIIVFETLMLNFSFLGIAAYLSTSTSLKWVNVPWRSYWTETPERTQECMRKMVRFLIGGAWGANLLVFAGQILVLSKNGVAMPAVISANGFVLVTFLLVAVYFAWMLRLFKPPR